MSSQTFSTAPHEELRESFVTLPRQSGTWGGPDSCVDQTAVLDPPIAPFGSFFASYRTTIESASFTCTEASFEETGGDRNKKKAIPSDEELALGSLSPVFGAVTLCCCQVGACLVAYASYLKTSSPYIGIPCFVMFGVLHVNSVRYLQEVWILARQRQFVTGKHFHIQYRHLVEFALKVKFLMRL